jgi:hypothetical protein
LRGEIKARMPRVDLPEILLEIAVRTGYTEAFTHGLPLQGADRTSVTSTRLCCSANRGPIGGAVLNRMLAAGRPESVRRQGVIK